MTLTRRRLFAVAGLATVAGCGHAHSATSATRPPATVLPTSTGLKVSMQKISYGADASQYGELSLPAGADPAPVVVVVHGGYWRSSYGLELGRPLAADLVTHGVAAWNIEYRRLGMGGGWPGTFEDVAAAIDALPGKVSSVAGGRLDLTKVVVVGHSAGGHIAAWLAGRHALTVGSVGAAPKVSPIGYVSQAGVLDLVRGYADNLGSGAVGALMGGSPSEYPERYSVGSPYARLPYGVPGTLVHGLDDDTVPISQSDRFALRAKESGDTVTEIRMPGVDHFALIDPTTPEWAACRDAALGYVGSR